MGKYEYIFFDLDGTLNDSGPGIRELLAKLKSEGKKLIVATSKNEYGAKVVLEHFELDQYFDFIAAANDADRQHKTEVLAYAVEQIGVKELSKAIMVGDRENDITAARNIGMDSIGVLFGYGDEEELTTAGATFLARSAECIGRLIDGNAGVPSMEEAQALLTEAAQMNPGPWEAHSRNVAKAARMIASECAGMDADKAYVLGLLHDIGRRYGVSFLAHVYDGYHFLKRLGYEESARIALTHSFNTGHLEDYVGKFDIDEEKQQELRQLLGATEQDDYDYLVQLCDAVAMPEGIVSIEKRMTDVKTRHGYYPQEKWDRNIFLKEYFEERMGKKLEELQ